MVPAQLPIVLAEVSDKIVTNWQHVAIGCFFLVTILAFATCRCLLGMLIEGTILGTYLVFLTHEFLLDPVMRDAVLAERGQGYYAVAFASLLLPLLIGIMVYVRQGRGGANPPPGEGHSDGVSKAERLACPACHEPFPLRRLLFSGWRKECPSCHATLMLDPRSGAWVGALVGLSGAGVLVGFGTERLLYVWSLACLLALSSLLTVALVVLLGALVPADERVNAGYLRHRMGAWGVIFIAGIALQLLASLGVRIWSHPASPSGFWFVVILHLLGGLMVLVSIPFLLFGRRGLFRHGPSLSGTSPSPEASGQ
jgi:hypothetical protein